MKSHADKKKFLEVLEETANISIASKRAGISRAHIYRWRDGDSRFDREMGKALGRGRDNKNDLMEGNLLVMAQKGSFPATKYYLDNNHPRYMRSREENNSQMREATELFKKLLEDVARLDKDRDDPPIS